MYIFMNEQDRTVKEIIPDIDPIFPGVPIEDRYAPDFLEKLRHFPDNTEVEQNWVLDEVAMIFSPPETGETMHYTITDAEIDQAYREGVNDAE